MAKSNRRKKHERDKAAVRRAEQERRRAKAERERQSAGHFEQLKDPSASPGNVAGILAAELPDRVAAADMMRLRMSLGVPAEEIIETARLLLEGAAPEPPGVGALAVAALAAHLSGDEDAEHDYARELLARAGASGDLGQRMAVIDSATGRDHPGETCELLGPYLREHPDDELAADIYARALAKAYVQAEPGELETAALERHGDRSGADALDHAVGEFAERTQWDAIIRTWMEEERAELARDRWRPAERDATDALLAEVAINFPFTSEAGNGDEDQGTPTLRCARCGGSGGSGRTCGPGGRAGPVHALRGLAAGGPVAVARRVVHRSGVWNAALRPVSGGGDRRRAAVVGVAGRAGAVGWHLARQPGRDLAQPGGR